MDSFASMIWLKSAHPQIQKRSEFADIGSRKNYFDILRTEAWPSAITKREARDK
jgi:hypothetical protein